MHITRTTATSANLDAIEGYYTGVLGLKTTRNLRTIAVDLGDSELVFDYDPEARGELHFAFGVSVAEFDEAAAWIGARTPLLSLEDREEFDGPEGWNSRSVYFEGPERSILEIIARRDLPDAEAPAQTGPSRIRNISEVGVAVSDVPDALALLSTQAAVAPYGTPGELFAPAGTIEGMLILVQTGRIWFPTTTHIAGPRPLRIEARGTRSALVNLGPFATLALSV